MKRLLFLFTLHFSLFTLHFSTSHAQGVPFIRNYTTDDYHAHNRNFDIEIGNDGTVFVANFEGLMYYDNAEWRILHTPGITRVTVVYCDHYGTVWVGGYNYFGRIRQKANGELTLQRIGSNNLFRGEVLEIWEENGKLQFLVNDGNLFKVDHDKVNLVKTVSSAPLQAGLSDIIKTEAVEKEQQVVVLSDVTQEEELENGQKAIVKKDIGIVVTDSLGHELYSLTEESGLCSNHVVYVAYNGHGILWGATDDGVFAVAIPSAFSHFTSNEGLTGEVLSIEEHQGVKYVGTNNGLYRLVNRHLQKVAGINHACWKLISTPGGLLAATANGVFRLTGNGTLTQLTSMSTTALLTDDGLIYCGEMNGVYAINSDGSGRKLLCKLEKVTNIIKDDEGTFWLQNLYGEVWNRKAANTEFKPYSIGVFNENAATIVPLGGR
jgi:ligand-binding sensor domain-containing protein